jgi:hypothetical protein
LTCENKGFERHATVEKWRPLPKHVFAGPQGGGEPIKLGIFAGIHGDEPEGVGALRDFLEMLEREPSLAQGFVLHVYPECNPTGLAGNTRHARSGKDLNREFWRGSTEPEVRWLETELRENRFEGIISLHTDDTSHGFYGYAHGATLSENLIEPALAAAESYIPRNRLASIDGFEARNGVIRDSFEGILRGPPDVSPRPFEIILETPQAAPEQLKRRAFTAALRTILEKYRELMAFAPNL